MEDRGMGRTNQFIRGSVTIFFLLTTLTFCATTSDLEVHYRLPPQSGVLKGKKVFLDVEDRRATKDILGKGAQKEFKHFSGSVVYSLSREPEEGFRIGVLDVPSLFRDAFRRRLENLGVEVVPEKVPDQTGVVIGLEEFLLDLVDRKWVISMAYTAELVRDGQVLAKQQISGKADRFKVVGSGQADTVTGELFTDLVNRLDVSRLFQQGNLLQGKAD
jgi:hypothetical protein